MSKFFDIVCELRGLEVLDNSIYWYLFRILFSASEEVAPFVERPIVTGERPIQETLFILTLLVWARFDALSFGNYENARLLQGEAGENETGNLTYCWNIQGDHKAHLFWENGTGSKGNFTADQSVDIKLGRWPYYGGLWIANNQQALDATVPNGAIDEVAV